MKEMKHIMKYEGYSIQNRLDDILDKISKYGIKSLTELEKEFLDSYSIGKESESHDKVSKKESELVFEDDFGRFKFEYKNKVDHASEIEYYGTLYVPDLVWEDGKRINGSIEGKIVYYKNNGQATLYFEKDGYDVFDFAGGLEYELDTFIDSIIIELLEKLL